MGKVNTNNKSVHQKQRKLVLTVMAIIAVGVVGALIIAGAIILNNRAADEPAEITQLQDGTYITVEGEYECLPKKGDGPHTLECAFGLLNNEGQYYALSLLGQRGATDTPSNALSSYHIGDRLRVSGKFYNDPDSSYDSVGVIEVDSVEPLQ